MTPYTRFILTGFHQFISPSLASLQLISWLTCAVSQLSCVNHVNMNLFAYFPNNNMKIIDARSSPIHYIQLLFFLLIILLYISYLIFSPYYSPLHFLFIIFHLYILYFYFFSLLYSFIFSIYYFSPYYSPLYFLFINFLLIILLYFLFTIFSP